MNRGALGNNIWSPSAMVGRGLCSVGRNERHTILADHEAVPSRRLRALGGKELRPQNLAESFTCIAGLVKLKVFAKGANYFIAGPMLTLGSGVRSSTQPRDVIVAPPSRRYGGRHSI
jgi:hypothetical protein